MAPRKPAPKPASTTIRVDSATHARLMKLADELDLSIIAVLRQALTNYERHLGRQLAARQLRELRADPDAWADFLGGPEEFPGVTVKR